MKRLPVALLALITAAALAGCGEISNTLTPPPGSANHITIALDTVPAFNQVGLFEARAEGYFAQTDVAVKFIETTHPLTAVQNGTAQIALSNEPQVMLTRNRHIALASVAAVVQSPGLVSVTCKAAHAPHTGTTKPAAAAKGTTTTATTRTTAAAPAVTHCSARPGAAASEYAQAPTYNGLNLVVTEPEIVNHADVLRRVVQAIARGYKAVQANPEAATRTLISANPSLNYTEELTGVQASLTNFFPAGNQPWGYQDTKQWNAFGSWLLDTKRISDVDAPINASTDELLAGQGV